MVIFRCLNLGKIICFQVHINKQCLEMNISCAFYATTQVHVPTNRYHALEFKYKYFYTL